MASRTLVLPCALAPTNTTTRCGMSISRRVKLRKVGEGEVFEVHSTHVIATALACGAGSLTLIDRRGGQRVGLALSQRHFQFDLIAQRDIVISNQRNARLDPSRFIHRAPIDGSNFKSAFLVKAERIQIVVGRDQKETFASSCAGFFNRLIDQPRANALSLAQAVQ